MGQSVTLKLGQGKTRNVKTGRGFGQGCDFSSIVHNLYRTPYEGTYLRVLETQKWQEK